MLSVFSAEEEEAWKYNWKSSKYKLGQSLLEKKKKKKNTFQYKNIA